MQVFGRSKICKRGLSVNSSCTFSVILIIDRSRTPGRLQPLGSFLFTGVAVKELTDLLHLFVTGFVKNALTTVFHTSRITFTDLTFRVIVKVLC